MKVKPNTTKIFNHEMKAISEAKYFVLYNSNILNFYYQ